MGPLWPEPLQEACTWGQHGVGWPLGRWYGYFNISVDDMQIVSGLTAPPPPQSLKTGHYEAGGAWEVVWSLLGQNALSEMVILISAPPAAGGRPLIKEILPSAQRTLEVDVGR